MKKLLLIFVVFSFCLAQNVTISFETCDDVLEIMKLMKNNSLKSRVEKKVDDLLAHKDYKAFFSFYENNFSNGLTKKEFKKMILSLKWNEEYRKGNRTIDGMIHLWRRVYNNLPHLQHKINQLRKISIHSIIRSSVRRANNWLPSGMKTKNINFIILADGNAAAYQVNNFQVYDIFQIPIDARGNIDKNLLGEIVAHESHHSGLKIKFSNKSDRFNLLTQFFSFFITEGAATKLVNNVYGSFTEKIKKDKPVYYFKAIPGVNIEKEWRKMFREEKDMFARFFSTSEKILIGTYDVNDVRRELSSYWMAYGSAKHYLIGSEIIGAIYFGYGKNGCFEVMKNPEMLITFYSKALRKNKFKLNDCPKVPESLLNLLN